MKFSELWIRELVKIKLNSTSFIKHLTMAGLEVSNVESAAKKFKDVLVGEIQSCEQHSSITNFNVVKVNVNHNTLLNIICRASNCRKGLKVAVAINGAILPEGFIVKTTKIYDQLSEGILCSAFKLGISEDYYNDTILELPADAPIGMDIREYLKLDDSIIEISVSPNRADCLNIIGIARDIAAINKAELNIPKIIPVAPLMQEVLPIKVNHPEICPRYLARIIQGINIIMPTPFWMKEKLRRCGIRCTDTLSDIVNYVLLEFGQPVHIFDKDKIKGGILLRMAKHEEIVFLPRGQEIKLNNDTLVVADYEKVLAIGGIFSGKHINVNEQTRNILVECAFFNSSFIFKYVNYYGLYNDISRRYMRGGVDVNMQYKAIERATSFIIDICGGKAGPLVDVSSEDYLPRRSDIILHRGKLDGLIGHHVDNVQINDILTSLGFKIIENEKDKWQVAIPSWRFDIEIEEDLIEEIARIYGYDNIPEQSIKFNLKTKYHSESTLSLNRIKTILNDKGYQEVITYSFVNSKFQQLIHPDKKALTLLKKISSEKYAMRLSLWTGLLETIIYNQNRQQKRMRIFETGLRFIPNNKANLGVCQDFMLAGAISGNRYEEHWDLIKNAVDFYDMKGDLESILDLTGKLPDIKFQPVSIPALHPGQSATICLSGKQIGFIGVIHPELEFKLGLKYRTVVFELELNEIADRIIPKVQTISRFPANRRDIAIVVAENVPAADILSECRKVNLNQIISLNLFDVYHGKGIAKGYKSLTISLIIQDNNHTLKEKEIDTIVNQCIETLKRRFHASLRNE